MEGTRCNVSGLYDALVVASLSASWLIKPCLNPQLPVLALVRIRNHATSVGRHLESYLTVLTNCTQIKINENLYNVNGQTFHS